MKITVFDTGPIVAALDKRDNRHGQCAEFLSTLTGRRLLPSPVLAEVCWLFEDWPHIEAAFLDSVARGRFELVHLNRPGFRGELVIWFSGVVRALHLEYGELRTRRAGHGRARRGAFAG